MLTKKQRPIFLNIKTIKFPITAVASILHRISGFFLFIMIGPILWLLKLSLSSEYTFSKVNSFLLENSYIIKFFEWIGLIVIFYHIIFGFRQILMDFGYLKQTLLVGTISAKIVFTLIIFISICIGIYIWFL